MALNCSSFHLVRIFQQNILADRKVQALSNDGVQNAPCIVDIECHLLSKFSRFNLLNAKYLVLAGVTRTNARDIPRHQCEEGGEERAIVVDETIK